MHPDIRAEIKFGECTGHVLKALLNVLHRLESTVLYPAGKVIHHLIPDAQIIIDKEATHCAFGAAQAGIVGEAKRLAPCIFADRTAQHDAAMHAEPFEARGQRLAADIVEIEIYAIGSQRIKPFAYVLGLIVNRSRAAMVEDEGAFCCATRKPYNIASNDIGCYLADHRTDAACSARKDH